MNAQSLGSPNRDNFGTPLWESREKGAIRMQVRWRGTDNTIWGRWWLPLSLGRGSQVSPRLPVACPNTKSVQNEF
jgi:hypothetical protein